MTGILEITGADYHADLIAEQPTLSRSIAHLLCTSSPAHAKEAHPKLNRFYAAEEKETFDLGNAAHELFLGGPDRVAVIEHKDWRTNDAKEQRHVARVEGRLPLLAKDWDAVQEMVTALRSQVEAHSADPPLFTAGQPEQTLTWEDEGVLCRCRVDWLRDDRLYLDDLKTTSRSASPEAFSRNLFSTGLDLQAEMYERAGESVFGVRPQFRFCVVESFPPFAMSVNVLGPDVMTLARKKVDHALGVWRRCLESGEWPGYEGRVATVGLPAYEESRWLAKEERELVA